MNDNFNNTNDVIYNLTLYLDTIFDNFPEIYEEMNDNFSGLPGYCSLKNNEVRKS